MGVLNVTPDSFSDGNEYINTELAVEHALTMVKKGATIIDIGGESSRPGSKAISAQEEIDRILPVIQILTKGEFLISVDSYKPEVQKLVLEEGVHLINDIMGGNEQLFEYAEKHQAGLILMHTSGAPDVMQENTQYENIISDIRSYFEKRLEVSKNYNIPYICMDPGIGFGKTLEQNLAILKHIEQFICPNWNLLIGTSRKSWIGKLFDVETNERLGASIASIIHCYQKGVTIFRVHDVQESYQAIQTIKNLSVDLK